MNTTPPLIHRIQVLLNTLIGEHHVRRALLLEVCDLLGGAGRTLQDAHQAALKLLANLDDPNLDNPSGVDNFDARVEGIARSVGTAPPAEGANVPGWKELPFGS